MTVDIADKYPCLFLLLVHLWSLTGSDRVTSTFICHSPNTNTCDSGCFVEWPHWTCSIMLGCGKGSAAWLGQKSSCCLGSACSLCPTKRKGWDWILLNIYFLSFLKEKSLPCSNFLIKKREEGDSSQIFYYTKIMKLKPKELEEDYRPISLMNKDIEVLTKLPDKI